MVSVAAKMVVGDVLIIEGTFCGGVIQGSAVHKEKDCFQCDFYKELKRKHGVEQNVVSFGKYVKINNQ